MGNVGHKFLEEVFEAFGVEVGRFLARMGMPEYIEPPLPDEFVIGVAKATILKGRVSREHDEEYYSCCKYIGVFSFIFLTFDLRGHVALSAQPSAENA